jgi:hypothetical protein
MNKTNINLSYTNIKSINTGSSMSLSKIYSRNKNVVNKLNEGFGEENGDHANILNGIQWVDDRDLNDANATKNTNR